MGLIIECMIRLDLNSILGVKFETSASQFEHTLTRSTLCDSAKSDFLSKSIFTSRCSVQFSILIFTMQTHFTNSFAIVIEADV